jgi:hypothetical protein
MDAASLRPSAAKGLPLEQGGPEPPEMPTPLVLSRADTVLAAVSPVHKAQPDAAAATCPTGGQATSWGSAQHRPQVRATAILCHGAPPTHPLPAAHYPH